VTYLSSWRVFLAAMLKPCLGGGAAYVGGLVRVLKTDRSEFQRPCGRKRGRSKRDYPKFACKNFQQLENKSPEKTIQNDCGSGDLDSGIEEIRTHKQC